jgi:hypothetical protein
MSTSEHKKLKEKAAREKILPVIREVYQRYGVFVEIVVEKNYQCNEAQIKLLRIRIILKAVSLSQHSLL